MRHAVKGRKLGRTYSHRKALFRNQLASLLLHERIQTTISKAKELRPLVERLVTLARRPGDVATKLHARRVATSRILHPVAVRRLFETIAPRFLERPGGYTRILKLGKRRTGDNAELAFLEFVDYVFEPKEKKKKEEAKKTEKGSGGESGGEAEPKAEKETARSDKAPRGKSGKGEKGRGKKGSSAPAKVGAKKESPSRAERKEEAAPTPKRKRTTKKGEEGAK